MSRCLVLAEVIDGALAAVTAEAVGAAVALGDEVVLAVAAADPDALVAAASFTGVTEIVTVAVGGSDRDHDLAKQIAAAVIADVAPDVVVAPFTIRSTSFGPALAHSLDLALVADAVALQRDEDGALTAIRSIYAGRVHAEVTFPTERPVLALVRPSVWVPADVGSPVASRSLAVDVEPSKVRALDLVRPSGDVDLTRADVIFSIGRGVGSQENIAAFADVAERLGVALAASRPVVDAGWLPAVHQVGQTGVTVKPRLYVAFGISGALHHLAGMQNSKTILAVNTDGDAPIFGYADLGAVADVHEVVEQLQSLI
jgi:electron transfer flavoprotein alpha subunit